MLVKLPLGPVNKLASIASLIMFTIALPVLLFSTSSNAVEIYSWVDDNGVQHFAGRPPDHDNYERMTVRSRGGNVIDRQPVEQPQQPAAQEQQIMTMPDRTVTVIDPEVIAANCERARNNIDLVNSRRRIVVNDDSGEGRRLNDDERAALTSESQAYIDENC